MARVTTVKVLEGNQALKVNLKNPKDAVQKHIFKKNGFYEKGVLNRISEFLEKDSYFIDIGANIGNHTIFCAGACGAHVAAFEPFEIPFRNLKENITLNNLQDLVTAHQIVLGKEAATASIRKFDDQIGHTQFAVGENGEYQVRSLDDILSTDRVDVIKIDVEGGEFDVLQGAVETLKQYSPILFVEIQSEEEFEKILNFLHPLGYIPSRSYNYTPTFEFMPIEKAGEIFTTQNELKENLRLYDKFFNKGLRFIKWLKEKRDNLKG